ncbi:hypothetical protein ES332_D03G118100v1 [Gossypium tomentosum]|uniref:tRNA uridine(34) hydroxylase N-terminal domain-containing protein n=1 Tax=Gossypium tomentosum TaxID=34277 RepID=A0A5D2LLK3_GOSTO|nr:hypothetical protein ES332_D03G118100v1 [Gossypium tomentosum]
MTRALFLFPFFSQSTSTDPPPPIHLRSSTRLRPIPESEKLRYSFRYINQTQIQALRTKSKLKSSITKLLSSALPCGLDIHGRIYINQQGINAQYSGPSKHSFAYVEWLKEDDRFLDILVQTSPAFNGHAFPKLKLRYKPSLVQ